jgi:hypothetical protein
MYYSAVAEDGCRSPVVLLKHITLERPMLNTVSLDTNGASDSPIRLGINNVGISLPSEPSVFFDDCGHLQRIEMTPDEALRVISDLKEAKGSIRLKSFIQERLLKHSGKWK